MEWFSFTISIPYPSGADVWLKIAGWYAWGGIAAGLLVLQQHFEICIQCKVRQFDNMKIWFALLLLITWPVTVPIAWYYKRHS